MTLKELLKKLKKVKHKKEVNVYISIRYGDGKSEIVPVVDMADYNACKMVVFGSCDIVFVDGRIRRKQTEIA